MPDSTIAWLQDGNPEWTNTFVLDRERMTTEDSAAEKSIFAPMESMSDSKKESEEPT